MTRPPLTDDDEYERYLDEHRPHQREIVVRHLGGREIYASDKVELDTEDGDLIKIDRYSQARCSLGHLLSQQNECAGTCALCGRILCDQCARTCAAGGELCCGSHSIVLEDGTAFCHRHYHSLAIRKAPSVLSGIARALSKVTSSWCGFP